MPATIVMMGQMTTHVFQPMNVKVPKLCA